MPKNLSVFFKPSSVAIIGASRSIEKVGSIILRNIISSGFKGDIYPINPNCDKLNDLKCYKNIAELEKVPDLVIVVTPANTVIDLINQGVAKGIKNFVIIAAGFKEVGGDGVKLENDLAALAKKNEINILGPNCLGFVNNSCPINATFGEAQNLHGNLRFISQSGAVAASLFDWCKSNGLGFSDFITLGNKTVLNENDILKYFQEQSIQSVSSIGNDGISSVSPIGLYLESITHGEEFLKLTTEISKKDPILVIKPGKTAAAASAMKSHTGAIAGEDDVLDAVMLQAGIIRCDTLEDFFEYSRSFAWESIPFGNRVAVISNAGGPAVISADAVITEGLQLAEFDATTKEALLKVLPRSSSIMNPVDVLGDALAERYANAAEIVLPLGNVDALLVILTPQVMTQIERTAQLIGELSVKYRKPVYCSFIGGTAVSEGEKILNKFRIPSFRFPERAIKSIGAMWKFKQLRDRTTITDTTHNVVLDQESGAIRAILQKAVNEHYKTLDNVSCNEIVTSLGINAPSTTYIENIEQARDFTKSNGWPVVLKLSSPGLLHKKDIGGVVVGITDETQLDDSFHKIQRKIDQLEASIKSNVKIQIQKEIVGGVEVIVGVKRDSTFGSVLLFGAGGTYADLIADKNIHLLPIDFFQAKELVLKSKVYNLLKAQHGEPEYAIDKLCDLMVRVGKMSTCIPEASAIEINPVIVTLNDVWAVDTKIIMNESAPKPVTASPPTLIVATTLSAERLASKFYHYKFESEKPLNFKPGQYISVKVASNAIRAYSIATSTDASHFELLVDTRPGGPGSKFFENLKSGDKMTYLGPFGVFTFKEDDDAESLVFLATGSGTSAVRCMIDKALMEMNCKKPITFYFGLTFEEEIFWRDHFEELEKKYSNFKFKIALFKPTETWKGATGFITELVKKDYPDSSKCAAYLCGHRAMIADATDLLIASGTPKERIYTERFI